MAVTARSNTKFSAFQHKVLSVPTQSSQVAVAVSACTGTPGSSLAIAFPPPDQRDFAWNKGEPTASDELLISVLKDNLCYNATGGLIQLGFPTPQSREELFTALSKHRLWRYAKGGSDDAAGLGAGTWTCSLMGQDAVDALRKIAPGEPAFAALLRLHDALEAAARAVLAETAATEQAAAQSEPRRGDRSRKGNPLQSLVLRLCTPTDTPSVMSLTHHRDVYGTYDALRMAALPPWTRGPEP